MKGASVCSIFLIYLCVLCEGVVSEYYSEKSACIYVIPHD